ncbi:hypothetical protein RA210_U30251 [Rubrivivax sp. A210]|nr:hypothetical protein RA210_U30251 [Rubrivivax sp. A210]
MNTHRLGTSPLRRRGQRRRQRCRVPASGPVWPAQSQNLFFSDNELHAFCWPRRGLPQVHGWAPWAHLGGRGQALSNGDRTPLRLRGGVAVHSHWNIPDTRDQTLVTKCNQVHLPGAET